MDELRDAGQLLEITSSRGGFVVRVRGTVDESADLTRVAGLRGVIVFDLDAVTRITSYGVRRWLTAMGGMEAQYYCFVRCRPAVVSQFNMISQFGGRGEIVTIYAPYVCTGCGKEFDQLIDLRRREVDLIARARAPVACPSCGAPAEFDDVPESYFSHVLAAPPPALPAAAESIVDGDRHRGSGRIRVDKDVYGGVTALWIAGALDEQAHFKRVAEGLEGDVIIIMADITAASDEGIARLRVLTHAPGGALHVARVPLEVAVQVASAEGGFGRARLLSVRLDGRCAGCGLEPLDVGRGDLASRADTGPACPRCGASLPAPPSLGRATALPWAEPHPDVQRYLSERPDSPLDVRPTLPPNRTGASPGSDHSHSPLHPFPKRGENSSHDLPTQLGRYEVLSRIAHGGMGVVYLGRVVGAGGFERRVALKWMHPHIADNPDFVAMFLDEARLAARIHHPNVVATVDIEQGPSGLFLVMDYVDGASLSALSRALRRQRQVLSPSVSLRIMLDVLSGLHAAHELTSPDGHALNLVHRDVSPQNLLVGVDGITRVTDFGIAHAATRLVSSTQGGQLKGKVSYMSPEQLRSDPVSRRSDVYSAGIVAWELFAGERLFQGENEGAALMAAFAGTSKSPSTVNRAVSPEVGRACLRALHQDPEVRYPSAAAFADALEEAARQTLIAIASTRVVGDVVRRIRDEAASARQQGDD